MSPKKSKFYGIIFDPDVSTDSRIERAIKYVKTSEYGKAIRELMLIRFDKNKIPNMLEQRATYQTFVYVPERIKVSLHYHEAMIYNYVNAIIRIKLGKLDKAYMSLIILAHCKWTR